MVSRGILQIFDQYQKARLVFAQSVAELALRPQNIEALRKAGILGEHFDNLIVNSFIYGATFSF